MELNKNDPRIAWLVRLTFGANKSRRPVKVRASNKHNISDYWDGGSRTYARYVSLATRTLLTAEQAGFKIQTAGNPFRCMIGEIVLAPEIAVVENSIFRGKDVGLYVIVHPDTLGRWSKNVSD